MLQGKKNTNRLLTWARWLFVWPFKMWLAFNFRFALFLTIFHLDIYPFKSMPFFCNYFQCTLAHQMMPAGTNRLSTERKFCLKIHIVLNKRIIMVLSFANNSTTIEHCIYNSRRRILLNNRKQSLSELQSNKKKKRFYN